MSIIQKVSVTTQEGDVRSPLASSYSGEAHWLPAHLHSHVSPSPLDIQPAPTQTLLGLIIATPGVLYLP